ncbi:MAG: beta-galactosidase small subunit, partial [Blautia faecis]
ECTLAYEVFGDGRVRTTLFYDPVKELGDMPEFGVIFKFNADYDHVSWYGLGESETYADRKKGAKLGIYDNMVKDNVARYMVPQECGAKEEVRWAKITDRKGRGMLFEMDKENGPMMFSALPYTPHEMENAMHPYELPQIHYTVVRVAKGQMGIAGDDSWGARTQEEYLLDTSKPMEFSFVFKGV